MGMNATMHTVPDRASEHAAATHTTWPPTSQNRMGGIVWAERLLASARTCSGDVARFAASVGGL